MFKMIGRRHFLATAAGTLASAVVVTTLPGIAHADDMPHLAMDDPTAKALNYTEDASQIDATKFPMHQANQACVNCNFFAGEPGGFGPCKLFPGKAVSSSGWCSGYAKEQ